VNAVEQRDEADEARDGKGAALFAAYLGPRRAHNTTLGPRNNDRLQFLRDSLPTGTMVDITGEGSIA
jgi:hypothetical protein